MMKQELPSSTEIITFLNDFFHFSILLEWTKKSVLPSTNPGSWEKSHSETISRGKIAFLYLNFYKLWLTMLDNNQSKPGILSWKIRMMNKKWFFEKNIQSKHEL